jgi:hypothetical protein
MREKRKPHIGDPSLSEPHGTTQSDCTPSIILAIPSANYLRKAFDTLMDKRFFILVGEIALRVLAPDVTREPTGK